MKKTFSKKRNQRKAIYIASALVIVSLLLGISAVRAQKAQYQENMYRKVQQIQTEKEERIETLSKDLEALKEQKAVTDTQLKEKAASEAQKASEIEKLKADLQAKADAEQIIASAPVGGRGGSDTAGNSYDFGYCTWYVKNRRPDLPNNLGDAHSWIVNGIADGLSTGSVAKMGAVGVSTAGSLGHVVYVEGIIGDGTILISEMNFSGWGVQSTRQVAENTFQYIY